MAPKKGTARVVKPRDKLRKSAKSTTDAAAARDAAKADNDLHLMWLCLKNNQGGQIQIDYKAVADALGITKSAAKQRYYKIKNHYEGLHTAAETTQGEESKSETQPEEEQDELPDYKSEDNEDDQDVKEEQLEDDCQEA